MKRTNLLEQLHKQKNKRTSEQDLLQEVQSILDEVEKSHERILHNLEDGVVKTSNPFCFDNLETHKIFHENDIRKICMDYRLRFLDSALFKDDLPVEAINEIRYLENLHNTEIKGFKIVAPAKCFKLKNADDPLLFAPIANGYYYLIHKWGNDLHPFRKLLMFPFKTIETLLCTMLLTSVLLTLLIPHGNVSSDNATFFILFLFMFKSVVGIVIYYAFSRGKNVSSAIWNSTYFNA